MIGASDHSCAYLVALGHQKADAVGGAHPSTVDTVQRCALPLFDVGNSDVFYNLHNPVLVRETKLALDTNTPWYCGRMTLKYALVFGVSGFVSKALLGRGSSLLTPTVFVSRPPTLLWECCVSVECCLRSRSPSCNRFWCRSFPLWRSDTRRRMCSPSQELGCERYNMAHFVRV